MKIERKWAMPNHETFSIKPIKEWIGEVPPLSIDPFARNSLLATHRNDLNPRTKADHHLDALEFLRRYEGDYFDMVLFDPPYSPRQLKECYDDIGQSLHDTKISVWSNWKNEVSRITEPGGIVLSFGWNTGGMGKSRGFEIVEILLVCHGSQHNDTICVRERKI